jgi:homocitrate synthase NifV
MKNTGRELHIVDTTLRDGEQRAGLAFRGLDKLACARALDRAGIFQIEAGIPAMCRQEKETIYSILQHRERALISTWNRMKETDIRASLDIGPDIIHIGVPVSDIQINEKLHKTRVFVEDQMKRCIELAASGGSKVTLGFEDVSRADKSFVKKLVLEAKRLGVRRIRYADTLGICSPSKIGRETAELAETAGIGVECHAHNDLGMAVANSLQAAKYGADFIDTTLFGIGERAGNCNLVEFLAAARGTFTFEIDTDPSSLENLEEVISKILGIGILSENRFISI